MSSVESDMHSNTTTNTYLYSAFLWNNSKRYSVDSKVAYIHQLLKVNILSSHLFMDHYLCTWHCISIRIARKPCFLVTTCLSICSYIEPHNSKYFVAKRLSERRWIVSYFFPYKVHFSTTNYLNIPTFSYIHTSFNPIGVFSRFTLCGSTSIRCKQK